MIYIHPDYAKLFVQFDTVDDFMNIDIDIYRDFKNRKTGRFEIDGNGFYIKKHFECGIGAVLGELIRLRKPHIGAGHERIVLDKLRAIHVDSMRVVAFGQEGRTLAGQRSFLVTEELKNTTSLETICATWTARPPSFKFKKSLIDKVAGIAKKLHDNGLNHRDFYICHFLLDTSGQDDDYLNRNPELFLIDLHRAQQRSRVPFRWRVKDIGGLYFSAMDTGLTRNDLFRFMRLYTGKTLRQTLQEDSCFWKAVRQRAVRTYLRDFGKSPRIPE